jgi:hypothetical protein
MAGLVPLRGRLVDYLVVDVCGSELILHRRLVETLDLQGARDLTMVGVASRDLFWKDLRRVLFSGARYTVFCRMTGGGLQQRWNPVKLAEAMSDLAPNFDDQLQQLVGHIQRAIRAGAQGEIDSGSREAMMRKALILYAQDAAALAGTLVSTGELEEAGLLDETQLARHIDVDSWREAFATVTNYVCERFGLELSSQQAHDMRWEAIQRAGLVEGIDHPESQRTETSDSSRSSQSPSTGELGAERRTVTGSGAAGSAPTALLSCFVQLSSARFEQFSSACFPTFVSERRRPADGCG